QLRAPRARRGRRGDRLDHARSCHLRLRRHRASMRAGRGADRRDRARMNLWALSAADLVAGYADGQFTPRDALDALLARIAAVSPGEPELTPGGSDGGAVAAVAAGLGPVAIATDGGGSIRRPAAHTGLVSINPSRDAVARGDGFPVILLDCEVIGPIARTVS